MLSCFLLLCEFCFFAGDRDNDRIKSFVGIPDAQYLYPVFVFHAQPIEPFLEDGVAGGYSLVEFHSVSEKKVEPAGRERRQQPDRHVREIPLPMWRPARDQKYTNRQAFHIICRQVVW